MRHSHLVLSQDVICPLSISVALSAGQCKVELSSFRPNYRYTHDAQGFCAFVFVLSAFMPTSNLCAQDHIEPTKEEVEATIKAFKEVGGRFERLKDEKSKTIYFFRMFNAKDEDLKKLPSVAFSFALDLSHTAVTNAGLKEIPSLNDLTET